MTYNKSSKLIYDITITAPPFKSDVILADEAVELGTLSVAVSVIRIFSPGIPNTLVAIFYFIMRHFIIYTSGRIGIIKL